LIFLLDTNVCIDLIRETNTPVSQAFVEAALGGSDLVLSSITAFELEIGVLRRGNKQSDVNALAEFYKGPMRVASFDMTSSKSAATLAVRLLKEGKQLSAYDALIGGHAIALGATLVTSDGRLADALGEFDVVNWRLPN
jgi:tRNA(fMet)-specific endonuclease VapC